MKDNAFLLFVFLLFIVVGARSKASTGCVDEDDELNVAERSCVNRKNWSSQIKLLATETAEMIVYIMFLVWLVWQEYIRLFH